MTNIKEECFLCPECGVWIPKPQYPKHQNSKRCEELKKQKPIRDKATKLALGSINKHFRGA